MADERMIGLLKRDDIVKQLVHVATLKGLTPDDLREAGASTWHWLAADAFGLDRQGRQVEASVIVEMRRQEYR